MITQRPTIGSLRNSGIGKPRNTSLKLPNHLSTTHSLSEKVSGTLIQYISVELVRLGSRVPDTFSDRLTRPT